jgi:ribosomal protein S18 acetylase RimI-like enzyme
VTKHLLGLKGARSSINVIPRAVDESRDATYGNFAGCLASARHDQTIMSSKIVTREFCIDDYEAALQLWQQVEGLEVAEGDDKEGVAQFLARNPGLSRVAIDGSTVVGVAMCGHDGRRGHIYHLAVDPAYRRYGLGRRLVQECLDGLRLVGVIRAIILVADNNLGGAEFWKRAGWEDIPGAVAMGIDV